MLSGVGLALATTSADVHAQLQLVELQGAPLDTPACVTSFPGNANLLVACERGTARIRSWIATPVTPPPPPPQMPATPVMNVVLDLANPLPGQGPAAYIPGSSRQDHNGLTGLAYHPDFELGRNFRFMFVRFNRVNIQNELEVVVRRYAVPMGTTVADAASGQDFFVYPFVNSTAQHCSGGLFFDPRPTASGPHDYYLYVPMPDGSVGSINCACGGLGNGANMERAQDDSFFEGKLLRFPIGYSPGPNPVPLPAPLPEIVAKGLRNPFGSSVDLGDPNSGIGCGDIWLCDTGSDRPGDLHVFPATGGGLCPGAACLNFGWPWREGDPNVQGDEDRPCGLASPCPPPGNFNSIPPYWAVPNPALPNPMPPDVHSGALIAGRVYRRPEHPTLAGRYFYVLWSNLVQGAPPNYAISIPTATAPSSLNLIDHTNDLNLNGVFGNGELHGIGTNSNGELLLIHVDVTFPSNVIGNGKIYRIIPD